MFITEEVFLIRHKLLEQSLIEAKISPDLIERWLDYNMKMKNLLVKNSISECKGRYNSEAIIAVEKPQ